MKFLLDANVAGSVSKFMRGSGHDIAEVINKDPRMPDKAILAWALKENKIIVTTDKDFEEMIWQQGAETLWRAAVREFTSFREDGTGQRCIDATRGRS